MLPCLAVNSDPNSPPLSSLRIFRRVGEIGVLAIKPETHICLCSLSILYHSVERKRRKSWPWEDPLSVRDPLVAWRLVKHQPSQQVVERAHSEKRNFPGTLIQLPCWLLGSANSWHKLK